MAESSKPSAIGMAVSFAAVAAVLAVILWDEERDRQIVAGEVATVAVASDVRFQARNFIVEFEYQFDGESYTGTVRCGVRCYDAGDMTTIYVDEGNPERFVTAPLEVSSSSWRGPAWGAVIVGGSVGLGFTSQLCSGALKRRFRSRPAPP